MNVISFAQYSSDLHERIAEIATRILCNRDFVLVRFAESALLPNHSDTCHILTQQKHDAERRTKHRRFIVQRVAVEESTKK